MSPGLQLNISLDFQNLNLHCRRVQVKQCCKLFFLVQKCGDWQRLFFLENNRFFKVWQVNQVVNAMGMILIYKKYYYYLYFWNGTRSTRPTLAINRSIAKVGRVDFSFNLRIRHPCADGNENMGPPFGWVSNLLSLKLSWEGGAVTAVTMSHCCGVEFVGPLGPTTRGPKQLPALFVHKLHVWVHQSCRLRWFIFLPWHCVTPCGQVWNLVDIWPIDMGLLHSSSSLNTLWNTTQWPLIFQIKGHCVLV